ncbi:MAG: DNA polymerase III subunit alpha [Rhodospirillales bacterium]|nr:DNA polymerase III subunit alpha [Rhodospirillales bacterium]
MSSHAEFVHLRVHSAYSLSEGAVRIKSLGELCHKSAMPAVAVTDTNNLFGAMEFSGALSGAGIQPIIGSQLKVHVTPDESNASSVYEGSIVLLVQNEAGYMNLLKLLSIAYLDGEDAHDPHIVLENLAKYNEGLIVLSGGPEGPLGVMLLKGKNQEAEDHIKSLKDIFKDRLYIEIMRHGTQPEIETEKAFLDFAYDMDIPLVATNEVFFPTRDMFEAHDALVCIASGRRVSETERRRLTPEHYFKSVREMKSLFKNLPEAIDNTVIIAQRCAYMVNKIDPILPPYDCGEGRTETDELRDQSVAGLDKRLIDNVYTDDMDKAAQEHAAQPYRERMDYELQVINDMGFPGYFLIVADFIGWSKDQNIPVGPGRGSGAGSVVAWALTITDLDPLRWGLLFERFLNPERVSMPDFDIDFCQDRRDEVIRYVQEKYGRDHVAQIITFGKLQARAVLRDVGRVLEMPYGYIDKICKMVPNNPADPTDLEGAVNSEPELRRLIREDNDVARLINIGKQLEGLNRHASTHAAGVVIGDRPLDKLIPLYRDPRSDMPVTGFNMKFVESAGLVKFDFLGLKTLTVLQTAEDLVRQRADVDDIDVSKIPLDDEATYSMISEGHTIGVFQLESAGMVDVLRKLKPDAFEVIIAVVALYRPGPMDNIPSFIKRKHGNEEIDYLYPTLESILSETFGVIIYQEQVMQIAQELSGYSLGGADLLRRAMGKKIKAEMDEQRSIFVEGAKAKGVEEKRADEIFDLVDKFAGYGFNKSHAAAYALVAYQTAYMKANYPVEFLAASMTLDMANTDKLNIFRQELDRIGIELLQPDINRSTAIFSVERDKNGKGAIRYALGAIKNVGAAAMESLVAERVENGPFADLNDFINRLDSSHVNKRQMENLVRAGAFDAFDYNRKQMFISIELIMRHAQAAMHERNDNQMGLFGGESAPVQTFELAYEAEWPPMDRLKEEFDAIGFYLSGHPLDAFGTLLKGMRARPIIEILESGRDGAISMAGTVIAKKERTSAKGNRYAFISLSDPSASCEVTAFSEALTQAREYLEVGQNIFVKGAVKFEDDSPRITVNTIESLDNKAANTVCSMRVIIDSDTALNAISQILEREGKGRGTVEIMTRIQSEDDAAQKGCDITIQLKNQFAITPAVMQAVRSERGILEVQEI